MVNKTDIEKLEPATTATYGSINPDIVEEPGTPFSAGRQSPLRVNSMVRPHWQSNLWYYSMILFTSLIALYIISHGVFLILKAYHPGCEYWYGISVGILAKSSSVAFTSCIYRK